MIHDVADFTYCDNEFRTLAPCIFMLNLVTFNLPNFTLRLLCLSFVTLTNIPIPYERINTMIHEYASHVVGDFRHR